MKTLSPLTKPSKTFLVKTQVLHQILQPYTMKLVFTTVLYHDLNQVQTPSYVIFQEENAI